MSFNLRALFCALTSRGRGRLALEQSGTRLSDGFAFRNDAQSDVNAGSASWSAFEHDAPLVLLGDPRSQAESEACPRDWVTRPGRHAIKTLKNVAMMLRIDSDACVFDGNLDIARSHRRAKHHSSAGRRELECVVQPDP